jgi:hypothetical protein
LRLAQAQVLEEIEEKTDFVKGQADDIHQITTVRLTVSEFDVTF